MPRTWVLGTLAQVTLVITGLRDVYSYGAPGTPTARLLVFRV